MNDSAILAVSKTKTNAAHAAHAEERSDESFAAALGTPRAVTRGESSGAAKATQHAKVDWLNATFVAPDDYTPQAFLGLLSKVFRRPVTGQESRGLFGFERGIKLLTGVGSRTFAVGTLAYGGESQRGRWMLQITGAGCGVVSSWSRMRKLLLALKAKITRVDLALDFLEGEYTVDDAVKMHAEGLFTNGGRPPSTSVAGDWLGGVAGRTLYVGHATNGKLLRVYEKGKQLGQGGSAWTRFEVQLGNRDRVIPLETLTECDRFFTGCYPAFRDMLDCAGQRIETQQTSGAVTMAHLFFHLKRSYGKLIDTLRCTHEFDYAEMIEEVRVVGAPRRLHPSAVASGLTWAQLLARLKAKQ